MEITHDSDASQEQANAMTMALLKRSPSRFDLSGIGPQPSPPRRYENQWSFSSDDSAPELVDDDRAESLSSFDEEELQYEPSTEELWNSFWGHDRVQERGWVGEDGPRCNVRDEDATPAFLAGTRYRPTSRRHWPCTPAVANGGPPELPLSFSGEDGSCHRDSSYHRDSGSRLKSSISYSLFPRALHVSAPATCFTNPFSPTSAPLTTPPLSFKCPAASKSTPHLPPPISLLPSPPMPSSTPPIPPRRKPAPLSLHKTTHHQRPFTSHRHGRSGISFDFDAPLSPRSRPPPPIPKCAATSPLPSPSGMLPPVPPSPASKPPPISKSATTTPSPHTPPRPRPRLPFLDRPLPPLPAPSFADPEPEPQPQPTSFFDVDDSDDEDGGAASPGLAARLKGKLHAHRRTASEGRRGVRGAEVAAAQLQRARRGTEGEVVVPERKNVLVRMLRMSRI